MTGLSDYTAKDVLNWCTGLVAMPALPAIFLALFTTAPNDAGSGGVEVTGNGYARPQIAGNATTNNTTASGNATLNYASVPAWIVVGMTVYDATTPSVIPAGTTVLSKTATTVVMSANATGGVGNGDVINFSAFGASSGSAPSSSVSSAAIAFAQATGSGWGTVLAWGLYDALSAGNYIWGDYLGNFAWLPVTISSASPGIITAKAHAYSAADPIVFTTEYGGTAPSFSQSNLTGVLNVVSPAADTFSVTNASTAVNTSSTGSGMVRKITQQPIAGNVTMTFNAGNFTLTSA